MSVNFGPLGRKLRFSESQTLLPPTSIRPILPASPMSPDKKVVDVKEPGATNLRANHRVAPIPETCAPRKKRCVASQICKLWLAVTPFKSTHAQQNADRALSVSDRGGGLLLNLQKIVDNIWATSRRFSETARKNPFGSWQFPNTSAERRNGKKRGSRAGVLDECCSSVPHETRVNARNLSEVIVSRSTTVRHYDSPHSFCFSAVGICIAYRQRIVPVTPPQITTTKMPRRPQPSRLPKRVTRRSAVLTPIAEPSVEEPIVEEEVSAIEESSPVTEDVADESDQQDQEDQEEQEEEKVDENAEEPSATAARYDSDEIVYSSDDDEGGASGAEEAVSAAAAKELALATAQVAREKEIREKTVARQKRREKAERLNAQQSTKKEKLASRLTRLPDELLQAAVELEDAEEAAEEEEEQAKSAGGKHTRLHDDLDDDARPKKKGKKRKGEYVVGGFRVVNRKEMKKPPAADPATIHFRRDHLLRPQIPRTDGKTLLVELINRAFLSHIRSSQLSSLWRA
ncbi:hypothetical protein BDZ88DRAFT_490027, partial [Geranomyces variabilis]